MSAGAVIYGALNGQVSATVTPRKDVNQRPVAIYDVNALPPTRTKTGIIARNYSVTIVVYADTYSQCQSISTQIISIMEGIDGTTVASYQVRYCTADYSGDTYDEEIGYGQDITINLTINEV